jgi:hypothetical protein
VKGVRHADAPRHAGGGLATQLQVAGATPARDGVTGSFMLRLSSPVGQKAGGMEKADGIENECSCTPWALG